MTRTALLAGLMLSTVRALRGDCQPGRTPPVAVDPPAFLMPGPDPTGPPVPVDPQRLQSIQKRISLTLNDVSRVDALRAIALAGGVNLVYESRIVSGGGIRFSGDSVSVQAALVTALSGTGTDVVLDTNGSVAIRARVRDAVLGGVIVIHGVILDSVASLGRGRTGQPVAAAVVSIVGPGGAPLARTVSDRAGEFRLPVDAGATAIQVRRIGFRPRDVPLPDSARRGNTSITLSLERIPATLPPVVTQGANCPKGAAAAPDARALWEQAQLGFLGTVVARDAVPARTQLLRLRQTVRGGDVLAQSVVLIDTVSTRSAKAARSPDDFAAHGYLTTDLNGRRFQGPDADILLHESFRLTHCFDLAAANRDHPGQVGIKFTPALGRDSLVDISGTLWLDRSPLALRSLEFRFEGVDSRSYKAGTGGSITFATAPNGIVIVQAWQVRIIEATAPAGLPILVNGVVSTSALTTGGTQPYLQVDGGALVSATWPDGAIATGTFSTIEGTVVERKSGKPVGGMLVDVPETPYHATTAADGSFVIKNVLPGLYTVNAMDPEWMAYGFGRTETFKKETVPDGRPLRLKFEMDPLSTALREGCNGSIGKGPVSLVGRVVDADGHALRAQVEVHGPITVSLVLSVRTPLNGFFSVCGLAPGPVNTVHILATDAAGRRSEIDLVVSDTPVQKVTITLPR